MHTEIRELLGQPGRFAGGGHLRTESVSYAAGALIGPPREGRWRHRSDVPETLLADRHADLFAIRCMSLGSRQTEPGLASRPRLLMLDEPSMGLAPAIADQIFERIETIHREKAISILLVEQRVAEALETCDHGYVLESGRVVLKGTRDELARDARVKKAYLGM